MKIENRFGCVEFDYKHDLNDEEGEHYLPDFYHGHVIELRMIKAQQKGGGHHLMQAFLDADEVKQARLLFLDCSPLFMEGRESVVMQRLHDFYAQYGFVGKTTNGCSRMWRIQALPPEGADCFVTGVDEGNDLHTVLQRRMQRADMGAAC